MHNSNVSHDLFSLLIDWVIDVFLLTLNKYVDKTIENILSILFKYILLIKSQFNEIWELINLSISNNVSIQICHWCAYFFVIVFFL